SEVQHVPLSMFLQPPLGSSTSSVHGSKSSQRFAASGSMVQHFWSVQSLRQSSVSIELPSSHCSPPSTMPFPHRGPEAAAVTARVLGRGGRPEGGWCTHARNGRGPPTPAPAGPATTVWPKWSKAFCAGLLKTCASFPEAASKR